MNSGGWTSAAGICESFNITMADLLTLCLWSQKDAKNRFQLAGLFDERLGACCEVLMMRALQGHGFGWIDPLRLHRQLSVRNLDMVKHLVHGTNWYAMDSILINHLEPGGGSLPSAAQLRGSGGLTPRSEWIIILLPSHHGTRNAKRACARKARCMFSMTYIGFRTTAH